MGRATLKGLKTAVLYKLLVHKNIPGRSKYRKRESRLRALDGTVTRADLAAVGAPLPPVSPTTGEAAPVPQAAKRPVPGQGARLDVPVVGLDVHEDTLYVALADAGGIVTETVLPNDAGGVASLLAFCAHHGVADVALESTGEYWLKVHWGLRDAGIRLLCANPLQTKATQGVKTDRHDARRIALAFRDGRLKPSVLCTREQHARRKLTRAATKEAQRGGAAINRFRALYHVLDAADWIRELHASQRGLRVLEGALADPDPGALEALLTREFATGKGRVTDPGALRARAGELAGFLGRLGVVPADKLRFTHQLEEYVACRRRVRELQAEVLAQAARDPALLATLELLVTLPSVGEGLALVMATEVVDADLFGSGEAAARWTGLAPRVNQSGHRKRNTGHITKAGNKHLRRACFIGAQLDYAKAALPGHPVGQFVQRLYKREGKSYKVAVTAGARKLLTYLFQVLRQRRPFQEIYAQQDGERLARNRERKLRALRRHVEQATLVDLLPLVVEVLAGKLDELDRVEGEYAALVAALLNRAPEVVGA